MPFEKVETSVDFPALERTVLQFWDEKGIFEKRKQLNAGKPRWSFLDGPITANNPMGVHHAWGRTYKDVYNRYFAMTGHELRYQNGFDCQGLWVEVEVERALNLRSKRDIENLGSDPCSSIAYFVEACKARVNEYARVQTDQSIRLGYWMDWDRGEDWNKKPDDRKSYFTMSEKNNYTIWAFLKECHGRGLIYRGYDSMPWCRRCGVGLSEMEMKEGYKLVEHRACFVKFPIKGRKDENLLVWTTTPWTLTSNVGAAINPDLTYFKVRLKGEFYYVAKGAFTLNRQEEPNVAVEFEEEGEPTVKTKARRAWLDGVPQLVSIEQHFKQKAGKESYELVGEVKGEEMLGWEYVGPFDDLPAQQHEYGFPEEVAKVVMEWGWCPAKSAAESHKIISGGADVTETEGTGIVHTAPGCGQIDFQWGKTNGLPPIVPLREDGTFHDGFGPVSNWNAGLPNTTDKLFEEMTKKNVLFATERYVHRYPHCWRCKTELLYRLVDEWFINMGPRQTEEGFRGDIMKVVKNPEVKFLPESINGTARELDWLRNMGDWMISKKRYWGLALPIWVDEKDPTQFEVIGSRDELKSRAVEGWMEFERHTPHRPWIDKVKIRNPKTGNLMARISDVGNPWLDAGIVALSTLNYDPSKPQDSPENSYWRKWYPADFITESFPGQFRNWFYALLAMSTMMSDGKPPFKTLLGHGLVRDQEGKEMHKSEGNSIEFIAAADDVFTLIHKLKPKEQPRKPDGAINVADAEVFDKATGTVVRAIRALYPAIGADVMRWLYVRSNPAANLNFGPIPANEVRSKVFFKLWNTYAMFCNYAIGDGFDPAAPEVPVVKRQDIDRWLLSNLQVLVKEARLYYSNYAVMNFALRCEDFIESKLSNWYVRRNKDRFHSRNVDLDDAGRADKRAAYQTLYTTLVTLCKLMAPCVPFITEVMWQNLRLKTDPESVHLSDFPTDDFSIVDGELMMHMQEVQEVISLGLSARQLAKINVRQPIAEVVVQAREVVQAQQRVKRAVQRFPELVLDELNVKSIRFHTTGELLTVEPQLNKKVVAPRLGAQLREVEDGLSKWRITASETERLQYEITGCIELNCPSGVVGLGPGDTTRIYHAPLGYTGVADRCKQVAIDTTITEDLKLEGLARVVIRQVQETRKNAKLDLLDKIALHLLPGSDELAKAIKAHKATIATAVQAIQWSETPLHGEPFTATVKIDGQPLTIALKKANGQA